MCSEVTGSAAIPSGMVRQLLPEVEQQVAGRLGECAGKDMIAPDHFIYLTPWTRAQGGPYRLDLSFVGYWPSGRSDYWIGCHGEQS